MNLRERKGVRETLELWVYLMQGDPINFTKTLIVNVQFRSRKRLIRLRPINQRFSRILYSQDSLLITPCRRFVLWRVVASVNRTRNIGYNFPKQLRETIIITATSDSFPSALCYLSYCLVPRTRK